MNNRMEAFDAAKLFAIILVIYGHCVQHLLSSDELENYAYLLIYSFHMPLFMIVSGFFSHSSLKQPFLQLLKKNSIHLLLPTAVWGGVIVLVRWAYGTPISLSTIIRDDLWFLKSLFICYILAYTTMNVKKPYRIMLLIITLSITQVSIFRMKEMYPCFLFGYCLKYYWDYFKKHKNVVMLFSLSLYILMGWLFINPSFFDVEGHGIKYITKELSILITGLSASVFFLFLSEMVCARSHLFKSLSKIGQYTLCIYLVQSVLLENIMPQFITFSETESCVVAYIVRFPIIVLAILAVSVFVEKGMNYSRIAQLLFLGKLIKRT